MIEKILYIDTAEGKQHIYLRYDNEEEEGEIMLLSSTMPPSEIKFWRRGESEWGFGLPVMGDAEGVCFCGECKEGTILWEMAIEGYPYFRIQDLYSILCGVYGKTMGGVIAAILSWFMDEGREIVKEEGSDKQW